MTCSSRNFWLPRTTHLDLSNEACESCSSLFPLVERLDILSLGHLLIRLTQIISAGSLQRLLFHVSGPRLRESKSVPILTSPSCDRRMFFASILPCSKFATS